MDKRLLSLILLASLFLLNMAFVSASLGYVQVTTFNDSTSSFYTTSTITKYVTLPINAIITNATVNLTGLIADYTVNITNATSVHSFIDYATGFGYIYLNFTKSGTQRLLLSHGTRIINITIPANCSATGKTVIRFKNRITGTGSSIAGESYSYCGNDATSGTTTDTGWSLLDSDSNSGKSSTGLSTSTGLVPYLAWDNSLTTYHTYANASIGYFSTCNGLTTSACTASRIGGALIESYTPTAYPLNVSVRIMVNETQVFFTSNLSDTQKVNLNTTLIQDFIENETSLPIKFQLANYATLFVNSLDIRYTSQLTFNFYDEDNLTKIMENITLALISNSLAVNYTVVNGTIGLNDLPLGAYQITYGKVNSDKRNTFYLLLQSDITEIDLYLISDETGYSTLQNFVYNQKYVEIPGLYSKLYRYYPISGTWLNVQSDLSDTFGQTIHYIREESTQYSLYFYRNATLLYQTGTFKLICTSGLCIRRFNIPDTLTTQVNYIIKQEFSNVTKIFSFNYTDPLSQITTTTLKVNKETLSGTTNICSQTIAAPSGNYTCNIGTNTGTFEYLFYVDGNKVPREVGRFTTLKPQLKDALGNNESSFWTFGFMLTFVALGTISPVACVFMAIFGLFFVNILGITPVTNTIVIIMASVMGYFIAQAVKR